jgi:hypothetical protein
LMRGPSLGAGCAVRMGRRMGLVSFKPLRRTDGLPHHAGPPTYPKIEIFRR